MKAIIIEESQFSQLRDLLKAECVVLKHDSSTPDRLKCDRQTWQAACDEIFRNVNYHYVRWAQGHGVEFK